MRNEDIDNYFRTFTSNFLLHNSHFSNHPFGEMTANNSSNTHGFTGKEYDFEMSLNYFCQRYYNPEIGRFITLDPFGGYIELPQSQNRYAYVMNNPLKYIDPLGLWEGEGWDGYPYAGEVPGVTVYATKWHPPSYYWFLREVLYGWGPSSDAGRPLGIVEDKFSERVLSIGWDRDIRYPGCEYYDKPAGGMQKKYSSSPSSGSPAPSDALSFPEPQFPSYTPIIPEWRAASEYDISYYIDWASYRQSYWGFMMTAMPQALIELGTAAVGATYMFGPYAGGAVGVVGAITEFMLLDKVAKEQSLPGSLRPVKIKKKRH